MTFVTNFNDILQKQAGALVSVQGIVLIIGDVNKMMSKNASEPRPLRKRNIQIVDINGLSIWVNLWNNSAESFSGKIGEINAFSNLRVGVYQSSTNLSSVPFTRICVATVDASIRFSYEAAMQRAVPIDGYTKLCDLSTRATTERKFTWIRVKLISFTDMPFYSGCRECRKAKLSDYCEKCKLNTASSVEMAMRIYVEDDICIPLTVFTSDATSLFGQTALYLKDNPEYLKRKEDELTNCLFAVRVSYYIEEYQERQRMKMVAHSIHKC
jgi:hypothetical protein